MKYNKQHYSIPWKILRASSRSLQCIGHSCAKQAAYGPPYPWQPLRYMGVLGYPSTIDPEALSLKSLQLEAY